MFQEKRLSPLFVGGFFCLITAIFSSMLTFLLLTGSPLFLITQSAKASSATSLGESTKEKIINAPGIITHGTRSKKQIALTFDADMTVTMKENVLLGKVKNSYDGRIINTLIATQTKATFFLTGMWIELFPQETKMLAQNPLFELENHSYSHPSFDGYCFGLRHIDDSQKQEEIVKTQNLLQIVAGVQSKYFRFPGGCSSQKDVLQVESINQLKVVHWDVVGEDGFNENTNQIIQNVVNNTQNGSIIVLHLNGAPTAPKTADALPEIISDLKAKGFVFVTVAELLHD